MWNYRIVKWVDDDGEDVFEIREVYYDEKGNPYGHCTAAVFGATMEELGDSMNYLQLAFVKPVLNENDFTGVPEGIVKQ